MFRENLYEVLTKIEGTDGKVFTAVFDKFDGGEVTAKETKYRPANGTKDQISLGGTTEVSNIKITRLCDEAMDPWLHWLLAQTGKAKMTVYKQPVDGDGNGYGKPLIYGGKLNATNPPKTDSESDSPALLELEQSSVTPIG